MSAGGRVIDQAAIEGVRAWVTRRPSRGEFLRGAVCRVVRYKLFGLLLIEEVTLWHFLLALLRLLALTGIASAPFWFDFLAGRTLESRIVLLSSGILLVLLIGRWVADHLLQAYRQETRRRKHWRRLVLHLRDALSCLLEDARMPEPSNPDFLKRASEKVLACIEQAVRLHLREYDAEYFQCSLLLFGGSTSDDMLVLARSNPSRPAGVRVPVEESIAFHVCRGGKSSKAIDDFTRKPFSGFSSLSSPGEAAPYRSILFVPIYGGSGRNGAGRQVKGCVTVDSGRPYEFWGTLEAEVVEQIQPFMRMLQLLLQIHPYELTLREGRDG